jgi:CPA1 family monovalent cation:H+ antiporter
VTANLDITTLVVLVIVVTLVAAAVRWVRLPYEVALVLTGLGLAFVPSVPQVLLTHEVILVVFLPVLLFHGAYTLTWSALRPVLGLVSFLALPGVMATAGLVGVALHLLAGLTWTSALLFGTIVAATDPVSVLAIFGQLNAPQRLTSLVSGESLFNDGTALVLFAQVLLLTQGSHVNVLGGVVQLVAVICGSLLLGGAVGQLGAQVLHRVDDALLETSITLIMAYGGYLLAEHLTLSGPLETVAAGLLLGAHGERVMGPTTRLQARATWEFLDFLATSILFLLVGLAVRSVAVTSAARLGEHLVLPLIVALAAVLLSRVVMVGSTKIVLAAVQHALPTGWATVLVWAGLRGAVSLAAALSLPLHLADRNLLLTMTFGVALFTIVAQGLTIAPVLRWLGLGAPAPAQALAAGDPREGVENRALAATSSGQASAAVSDATEAVSTAPQTLAPVLALVAEDQHLDAAELARWLGTTPGQLDVLRRMPRPGPEDDDYAERVRALALLLACDSRILQSILRGWWARGIIWPLRAYQQRYRLSDIELAAALQMPAEHLDRLVRELQPEPGDHFDDGVARIADAIGCNPDRLAAMLTGGDLPAERAVQQARLGIKPDHGE